MVEYVGGGLLIVAMIYFGGFFVLGKYAPHSKPINRFYSSFYMPLRQYKEREYINKLRTYRGEISVSGDGEVGITTSPGKGVGFIVPEQLESMVMVIPRGSEVEVDIGYALSENSIGIYYNELRDIRVLNETSNEPLSKTNR